MPEAGTPLETVEADVQRYIDSYEFEKRHAGSAQRWRAAAGELWSSSSETDLTAVGHAAREAMQLFATELVALYSPPEPPADVTKTVRRLQAVLAHVRDRHGTSESAFLSALVAYWGTVSDLAQRQEHAGVHKGEALTWEDARRLVFQTILVMYEVDRSLERPRARS